MTRSLRAGARPVALAALVALLLAAAALAGAAAWVLWRGPQPGPGEGAATGTVVSAQTVTGSAGVLGSAPIITFPIPVPLAVEHGSVVGPLARTPVPAGTRVRVAYSRRDHMAARLLGPAHPVAGAATALAALALVAGAAAATARLRRGGTTR